ncbi:hypothetical protein [Streptomyces sp. MAR4 CNX-425]|uniref:hypothetical protein n=1 Tax=Streptomyces sp. MAR4 CNX-425 TaxID=3406343 RepID=UPI003B503C74
MHETSSDGAAAASQGAGKAVIPVQVVAGRGPLTFLRATAALCLLQTLMQGLLAGMYMGRDVDSIDAHAANAFVYTALVIVQLVAAVLVWRQNRWLKWPLAAGVGILLTTFIQVFLGEEGSTAAHVTIGVLMCAMQTTLLLRSLMLRVQDAPAAA